MDVRGIFVERLLNRIWNLSRAKIDTEIANIQKMMKYLKIGL